MARRRHSGHRSRWPLQTPAVSPHNSAAVMAGPTASPRAKTRKPSPCQQQQGSTLPEDIWCHIHSLLPLRDAARAACVSHAFRLSWRRLPSLTFSEDSLGVTRTAVGRKEGLSREFARKVDHILNNHSRSGVRALELRLARYSVNDRLRLDRWLQMALTPGIEEITVSPSSSNHRAYEFPCSLLSDGKGDSVRHLRLTTCSFHPTVGPWSSRNLVEVDLSDVDVTGDGLRCLLSSSSSSLERFSLRYCSGVTCLDIPDSLRRLVYLAVVDCHDLATVENRAPNLSTFDFACDGQTETHRISLGVAPRLKELHVDCSGFPWLTRAELASSSITSKVETAESSETVNSLAGISSKSPRLERLYIEGIGSTPFYLNVKYCAMVSLFGASHSVEDAVSYVSSQLKDHVLFCGGKGKRSALSMIEAHQVEGACHMLKAWLS